MFIGHMFLGEIFAGLDLEYIKIFQIKNMKSNPTEKMSKRLEQTCHKRRYTNSLPAQGKELTLPVTREVQIKTTVRYN